MAKKKKTSRRTQPTRPESTATDRVAYLCRVLWNGNRSAMAQTVGVSHTSINRAVSGERPPGRRLLAAIAEHPKVNPGWLLTGDGEPMLAERADVPTGNWMLPIANTPLPNAPRENNRLLSGEQFPVAGAHYSETRYWLEIQPGEPIVRSGMKVDRYDLLLMETDTSGLRQPSDVDTRLCIIRHGEQNSPQLRLAEVTYYPGDKENSPYLEADMFDGEKKTAVDDEIVFQVRISKGGKPEVVEPRRKPHRQYVPPNPTIEIGDIVATCVFLLRR